MDQTRGERNSWKDLAKHITDGISEGRFPAGSKLPSEADLMRQFSASKTTVHRALRELAALKMVRRVERLGTFVTDAASRETRKIGLVIRTSDNFLEFKLLQGIREAVPQNCQLVLYDTGNDFIAEYEAVNRAANEVDGMLIVPTCSQRTAEHLQDLYDNGLPIVCVDRYPVGLNLPGVTTNNYDVSRQALGEFAAAGHRYVAYFGIYNEQQSALHDRYEAYQDFCRETVNISPDQFVRLIPPRPTDPRRLSLNLIEDALVRLLSGDTPITVAFCANEFYLDAILGICKDLPPSLVERLEILSFSDSPRPHGSAIPIHLIRQDAVGVGRASASLLNHLFEDPESEQTRVEVEARIVHAAKDDDLSPSSASYVSPAKRSNLDTDHA